VICHNGLGTVPEHNVGSSKEYWTMHSRAIQQGSVEEEGYVVNSIFFLNIMKVNKKQAQAKFVPAAAVKRIVRVFDLVTRCIRPQRRLYLCS